MPETKIITGDCRQILRTILDNQIHCVVTSPPYWGLRDYGVASQIGLEQSPQQYVQELMEVFREVRRVLRPDGTLWLNLGDSYAGSGRGGNPDAGTKQGTNKGSQSVGVLYGREHESAQTERARIKAQTDTLRSFNIKPKDLVGIPWRVAFALQQDGWYLRQDIIWAKPNPMPESVRDRCTKSHEYLFLLSKSEKYYFDCDAIKEPASAGARGSEFDGPRKRTIHPNVGRGPRAAGNKSHKYTTEYDQAETEEHRTKAGLMKIASTAYETRNKRSVWTVGSKPFKEAHFATFPPKLVEPCVLAGCPPNGIVLDPFCGAGTTGVVSKALNRHFVGIELKPEYAEMAQRRIENSPPSPPSPHERDPK